jgi:hypothetical protein
MQPVVKGLLPVVGFRFHRGPLLPMRPADLGEDQQIPVKPGRINV